MAISTIEREYPVAALDKGMDRSKPRHLIGDNYLWTAENVRFDIGKVKPILTEGLKFTLNGGANGIGLLALDYKIADASLSAGNHFLAYGSDAGTDTVYFLYGDAYASDGGNVASTLVNRTAGDVEIYGKIVYVQCNSLNFSSQNGLYTWTDYASPAAALGSAYNPGLMRIFQNFLFYTDVQGNIARLGWTDYGAFATYTGGQSGSRDTNFAHTGLEQLGNYLILYNRRGIRRLSYIGPPTLFNIEDVSREIGAYAGLTSSPCLEKHGLNYFVSDIDTKNIFIFDGTAFKQIGLPIRDHVFALLDGNANSQVIVTHNPPKNEICFWVAKTYSTIASNCHLYIFNYVTQAWSYTDLSAAVIENANYIAGMTRRFSPVLRFAVRKTVTTDNKYLVYEADSGTTMKIPLIETKFYDLGRPDIFKRLTKLKLILSKGVSKNFTVSIAALDDPEDTPSYTDFTLSFASSGEVFPDMSGRYFAVKITTTSADYTTEWELDSLIFTCIDQGGK